jgi:transcriptional regulator with XRE-family HTH domain
MESLKRIREALGLTQKVLAQRIGVDKMTVWKWENDKMSPSPLAVEKLKALAKQTKMEISFPPRKRKGGEKN